MKGFGYRAETLACIYLLFHGYRIVRRNYHSRFGEIDIIAQKKNTTVFVEVKARSGKMLASPACAVDIYKQQKLIKTAYGYMSYCDSDDFRFDVIEVTKQGLKISVNHIKDAFQI